MPVVTDPVVALLTLWLAWPLFRRARRTRFQTVASALGAVFGIGFGVLAALAILVPQSAGGAFNLAREFVRYSALGVGVVFLLFVLVRALPLGLDLLEPAELDPLELAGREAEPAVNAKTSHSVSSLAFDQQSLKAKTLRR